MKSKEWEKIKRIAITGILAELFDAGYTEKHHKQLYIWVRTGANEEIENIKRYLLAEQEREYKDKLKEVVRLAYNIGIDVMEREPLNYMDKEALKDLLKKCKLEDEK